MYSIGPNVIVFEEKKFVLIVCAHNRHIPKKSVKFIFFSYFYLLSQCAWCVHILDRFFSNLIPLDSIYYTPKSRLNRQNRKKLWLIKNEWQETKKNGKIFVSKLYCMIYLQKQSVIRKKFQISSHLVSDIMSFFGPIMHLKHLKHH